MTRRAERPPRWLPRDLTREAALEIARELLELAARAEWGEELCDALGAHLAQIRPEALRPLSADFMAAARRGS